MPIFSLPSDFGIGTLGRDACDFIDFLAAADVHVWEIMPICHTDSSFSPHNALCARAGNPLLIDLQPFVDQVSFPAGNSPGWTGDGTVPRSAIPR